MKNYNIAIEKGKRYFEKNIISFYFVAIEFIFKKEEIKSGCYRFDFKNNGKTFLTQNLKIDVDLKKVNVEKSHEDPLIESNDNYFICGQLTTDLIKKDFTEIECLFYFEEKLIRKEKFSAESLKSLFLLEDWNSHVDNYVVKSKEDCTVRVHLGKSDSTYYEEEYSLRKGEVFNFEKYLENHEYVAVQCSYEKDCDLEEKHVFKGVKGIFNSQYYINEEDFIPIFPFSKKYTKLKYDSFIKINSFEELINYYKKNENDIKKTFEMDEQFIVPYYKNHKTSAIGKLYSDLVPKKYHVDSNLCRECDKKSECMQLIPSGLSEIVFKKNLMVESFKNCSINKLIKSKE